mmetsp:Transcript_35405/g.92149  ORF Transcript_35405/g.92149 Transcript_35405/m.92149 type:complete len:337 (+) Transcript_35405:3-1013(+)
MESFESVYTKEVSKLNEKHLKCFREQWAEVDPDADGQMDKHAFGSFMFALGEPLGLKPSGGERRATDEERVEVEQLEYIIRLKSVFRQNRRRNGKGQKVTIDQLKTYSMRVVLEVLTLRALGQESMTGEDRQQLEMLLRSIEGISRFQRGDNVVVERVGMEELEELDEVDTLNTAGLSPKSKFSVAAKKVMRKGKVGSMHLSIPSQVVEKSLPGEVEESDGSLDQARTKKRRVSLTVATALPTASDGTSSSGGGDASTSTVVEEDNRGMQSGGVSYGSWGRGGRSAEVVRGHASLHHSSDEMSSHHVVSPSSSSPPSHLASSDAVMSSDVIEEDLP